MFSIQYPSILSHLGQLAYGLQPVELQAEGRFTLLIKATKEAILTARLNKQIKIYLVPDEGATNRGAGFITAFFDDHDEPIVLFSPLYHDDALLIDLTAVLGQASFDLYFFDEHDREMMGVRAHVQDAERFRATLDSTRFLTYGDLNEAKETLQAMADWFGRRTADDDGRAFTVQFEDMLYPDDLIIIDARPDACDFRGAAHHPAVTSLERNEPGVFQEYDIARLLRRVFSAESIFLNPVRTDAGTELADILCVTDEALILIQAKDSPNNEATLRRTIDRKHAVIRGHIEKAARQLRGALSHVTTRAELVLSTSSGAHTLTVSGRLVFGLVVVREMFDDDYGPCSVPVLAVARDCGVPCVLLDYAAMHMLTLHLGSPMRLLYGFYQLFESALENGQYPKPRFIGPPGNAAQDDAIVG